MFRYTILAENRAFLSAENRACRGATNGDGSAKARRRRRARRREDAEPTAPRKTGGAECLQIGRLSLRRRRRTKARKTALASACNIAVNAGNTPVKAQPLRRVNLRLLRCVNLRLERKSAVGGRRESGGRAGRAAASPDGKPSRWGKKTLKAKPEETPKSETAGSGGAIKRGASPQRKDAGAVSGRSGKALAFAAP